MVGRPVAVYKLMAIDERSGVTVTQTLVVVTKSFRCMKLGRMQIRIIGSYVDHSLLGAVLARVIVSCHGKSFAANL